MILREILAQVSIGQVWATLGGDPPRRGRARAFWRPKADGLNVSINESKGAWFDHRDSIGGGILALVQRIRGGDRGEALRWLADRFGLPLEDRKFTPADRRRYREVMRAAPELAHAASWWLSARLSELEDEAREAADGATWDGIWDVARELHTLHNLSAEGAIRAYLAARTSDPEGTAELVRIGRTWDRACQRLVRLILDHIGVQQAAFCRDLPEITCANVGTSVPAGLPGQEVRRAA